MRGMIGLGIGMLGLIGAGMQASAAEPPALPQPVQRIQLRGFSFQPVDESGWLVLGRTPMAIALSRRGDSDDETIVIQAGVLKYTGGSSPAAFAAAWKDTEDKNTDPNRFKVVGHDVAPVQYKSASCVRSHATSQDDAPHTVSHKSTPMLLEILTLACIHPADPGLVVNVSYSQRHYADRLNADFMATAQGVLDSLEFIPLLRSTAADKIFQYRQVASQTDAAQALQLQGGPGNDWTRAVLCSKDSSCTQFGFTDGSFSDTGGQLLVHLDRKRVPQWAETIGGGNRETLWQAITTADGGYLTLGSSESNFDSGSAFESPQHRPRPLYMRLDANGKILWAGSIELESEISGAEAASAYQTVDGGFLIAGSYSEAFPPSGAQPMPGIWSHPAPGKERGWQYTYPVLLKLSADGKPQWLRRYAFDDHGGSALTVTEMPAGHVLVTGSLYKGRSSLLFVLETDAQGAPLHARQYELSSQLGTNAMVKLQDGDYFLVGHANSTDAPASAFSAVFTPDLKLTGGSLYQDASGLRAMDAVQGPDGRLCIVGRTENPNTNSAQGIAWLLDEHGGPILAELRVAGTGNTELESASVLADGGYRLAGDSNAFDAAGFDQLVTDWSPAHAGSTTHIQLAPFKPDSDDLDTDSDTATLELIKAIPPAAFEVTPLTLPKPGAH